MKHMINAVMIVASLCATGLSEVRAYANDVSANGSTMAGAVPADGTHAGDLLVRLRAISIEPEVHASGTLSSLGMGVNNALVPELNLIYMIRDAIGVELILGTSRQHVTSGLCDLGGVNVLPPTLLQYHLNHAGMIRPYVGAGVNYTYFYNDGPSAGPEGTRGVTRQLRSGGACWRRRADHEDRLSQRGYQEDLNAHGCLGRRQFVGPTGHRPASTGARRWDEVLASAVSVPFRC
ncbi:OmpW family protein [Paraburkholderia sp. BL6669N2]|nr:OmpW family protein [Paraburkholderia sp. BL6669N2]